MLVEGREVKRVMTSIQVVQGFRLQWSFQLLDSNRISQMAFIPSESVSCLLSGLHWSQIVEENGSLTLPEICAQFGLVDTSRAFPVPKDISTRLAGFLDCLIHSIACITSSKVL